MPPNLSRCEVCKAGRGVGATVKLTRTHGIETWYVCSTCAGRVVDVLYGRDRVRV